jgi:hypothetical protein
MKKLLLIIVVMMLYGISSCSKDDSNPSATDTVVSTVSAGTWKITYFFDTDKEETSNFIGYNFTFGSNNVLTASNGTTAYNGYWSIMNNSSNDDSLDNVDFIITFSSPANFEELSEDWEILSRTDRKIELKHVSGGNGGTDLLTFEKN